MCVRVCIIPQLDLFASISFGGRDERVLKQSVTRRATAFKIAFISMRNVYFSEIIFMHHPTENRLISKK